MKSSRLFLLGREEEISCINTSILTKNSDSISDSDATTRRDVIQNAILLPLLTTTNFDSSASAKEIPIVRGGKYKYGTLYDIHDPNSYKALVYKPTKSQQQSKYPVLVLIHGAGKNDSNDVWSLADPNGEHAGLIPSLLLNNNSLSSSPTPSSATSNNSKNKNSNVIINYSKAPVELLDNFIVIAPYSYGKKSFYEEPRSKVLQFIKWACEYIENDDAGGKIGVDTDRLFLFGFRCVLSILLSFVYT